MRLSVVIPTLNEAAYLPRALRLLRRNAVLPGSPAEILVSDCRSQDETLRVAAEEGARVLDRADSTSRAEALNAGAGAATGDAFLFLHGDGHVPRGYDAAIARALARPDVLAGVFDFAFEGKGLALRLFEVLNRVRGRIEQRPFGDQGFFVRAEDFRRLGGFPRMGLMEDARFSDAVTRAGRLIVLRDRITVSSRRVRETGALTFLWQLAAIWWYDCAGLEAGRFGTAYLQNNRRRANGDGHGG